MCLLIVGQKASSAPVSICVSCKRKPLRHVALFLHLAPSEQTVSDSLYLRVHAFLAALRCMYGFEPFERSPDGGGGEGAAPAAVAEGLRPC